MEQKKPSTDVSKEEEDPDGTSRLRISTSRPSSSSLSQVIIATTGADASLVASPLAATASATRVASSSAAAAAAGAVAGSGSAPVLPAPASAWSLPPSSIPQTEGEKMKVEEVEETTAAAEAVPRGEDGEREVNHHLGDPIVKSPSQTMTLCPAVSSLSSALSTGGGSGSVFLPLGGGGPGGVVGASEKDIHSEPQSPLTALLSSCDTTPPARSRGIKSKVTLMSSADSLPLKNNNIGDPPLHSSGGTSKLIHLHNRGGHHGGREEDWNYSKASVGTVTAMLSSYPVAGGNLNAAGDGFSPHSSLPSDPQSSITGTALPHQQSSAVFTAPTPPPPPTPTLPPPLRPEHTIMMMTSSTGESSNRGVVGLHQIELDHRKREASPPHGKTDLSRSGATVSTTRREKKDRKTARVSRRHTSSKSPSKSTGRMAIRNSSTDDLEPDFSQFYVQTNHRQTSGTSAAPSQASPQLLSRSRSYEYRNGLPPHPLPPPWRSGGNRRSATGSGGEEDRLSPSPASHFSDPKRAGSFLLPPPPKAPVGAGPRRPGSSIDLEYLWEYIGSGGVVAASSGSSGAGAGASGGDGHHHHHVGPQTPGYGFPRMLERGDTQYTSFSGTGRQGLQDEGSLPPLTFQASYAGYLPQHLHALAGEIQGLNDHDLVHIAFVTERMAEKEVYSSLAYSGANWFLPELREVEEGERRWELGFNWREGIILTVGGQRLALRLLNLFVRLVLLVLIWLLLFVFLPHRTMEPGGVVFDPVVLVLLSAVVGGLLCRLLRIPPVVGVMWVAICWHNVPTVDYLTSGISNTILEVASKAGLTVILAKAGYSISPAAIRPHWRQTLLLATVPFAMEGIIGSLIANALMPYHGCYSWAFLQGMLCAVGSPAVIIPAANFLRNLGYREEEDKVNGVGPLSLMISAIPLEIVLGVWCSNFILSLLFEQQTVILAVILAPVQLLGGAGVGVGLAYLFHYVVELLKAEAKRLPNGRYPPSHFRLTMNFAFVLYMVACFVMVMGGYKLKLAGGGCVMCVSFCATVSYLWMKPRKVRRAGPRARHGISANTNPSGSNSSRTGEKKIKKSKSKKENTKHRKNSKRHKSESPSRGGLQTKRSPTGPAPHTFPDSSFFPEPGLPLHGDPEGPENAGDRESSAQANVETRPEGGYGSAGLDLDAAENIDTTIRVVEPLLDELAFEENGHDENNNDDGEAFFVMEVSQELKEQKIFIGAWLSDLWDELMMPVLFASMGANIDLKEVFSKSFFPKAFALLVIGTLVRFLCIMAVQTRSPLSWRRRLVVGIGYLGKASAQASVGPLAATMMLSEGQKLWGEGGRKEDLELHEQYTRYASEIKSISALYVMVMAMVASVGVVRAGVVLLGLKKHNRSNSGSCPTSSEEEKTDLPTHDDAAATHKLVEPERMSEGGHKDKPAAPQSGADGKSAGLP